MDFLWCVAGFTFYFVVVLIFSIAIFLLLPVELINSQAHILTGFIYRIYQVTYFFGLR
jgi:hypothetical protein